MDLITNEPVLVLNKHYLAVQVCSMQRAIGSLVTRKAKVVDENYLSYSLKEWIFFTKTEKNNNILVSKYPGMIRSPSVEIFAPLVIMFYDCEYTKPSLKGIRYSRKNIFQRDNNTCQYCGKKCLNKNLNIDHIIPRSKGGLNSWKNVVACCLKCNEIKGDKFLMELGWKLIQKPEQPKWKSHVGKSFNLNKRKYWESFLK